MTKYEVFDMRAHGHQIIYYHSNTREKLIEVQPFGLSIPYIFTHAHINETHERFRTELYDIIVITIDQ